MTALNNRETAKLRTVLRQAILVLMVSREAVSKIKIEAAFFILTLESKIFESLVF